MRTGKAIVSLAVIGAAASTLLAAQTLTVDSGSGGSGAPISRRNQRPVDVNVLNFPAVQAVSGSVSVDNLPVDADGALLVSSAPAKGPVRVELLTESVWIQPLETHKSAAVNTAGFSRFGIRFDGYGGLMLIPEWR